MPGAPVAFRRSDRLHGRSARTRQVLKLFANRKRVTTNKLTLKQSRSKAKKYHQELRESVDYLPFFIQSEALRYNFTNEEMERLRDKCTQSLYRSFLNWSPGKSAFRTYAVNGWKMTLHAFLRDRDSHRKKVAKDESEMIHALGRKSKELWVDESNAKLEESILLRVPRSKLLRVLEHLTPKQRQAIGLVWGLDGHGTRTYSEVGAIMGVTRQAATLNYNAGMTRLKRMLVYPMDA